MLILIAATRAQAQSAPSVRADSLFMHVFSIKFGMGLDMYYSNGRAGSFSAMETWDGGLMDSDYTTVSSQNNFFSIHAGLAGVEDSITFYLDTVMGCLRDLRIFDQNWSNMQGGPGPGAGTITITTLPYSIDSFQHLHAAWSCHDCWQTLLAEGVSINYSDTRDENGVWYTGYATGFGPGTDAFVTVDAGLEPSILAVAAKDRLIRHLGADYDAASKSFLVHIGSQKGMNSLTIFDMLGRKLYAKNVLPDETGCRIDLATYPRGMYILCDGAETLKFVVP